MMQGEDASVEEIMERRRVMLFSAVYTMMPAACVVSTHLSPTKLHARFAEPLCNDGRKELANAIDCFCLSSAWTKQQS
jgi:hypothetical protein